jgi:hypothetical protein
MSFEERILKFEGEIQAIKKEMVAEWVRFLQLNGIELGDEVIYNGVVCKFAGIEVEDTRDNYYSISERIFLPKVILHPRLKDGSGFAKTRRVTHKLGNLTKI